MKILAISDEVIDPLYSPRLKQKFADVDLVLGCGDLPFYYLEFVVTLLDVPLYYVPGNHDKPAQYLSDGRIVHHAQGCESLDSKVATLSLPMNHAHPDARPATRYPPLLLAGLGGCLRYNADASHQYSQGGMTRRIWQMTPALMLNRLRYGRALDILVTHAPPRGIHDSDDQAHTGFDAFLPLMARFRPRFLLHGHSHVYRSDVVTRTQYQDTTVLNVYPYRVIEFQSYDRQIFLRARADFAAVRTKAVFRQLLAVVTGQKNELLSFNLVSTKLHIGGPIYRGVRAVPVANIIGSVNRYRDFDRAFLPTQDFTASRWQSINRAWYEDVNLPPVLLYQVGEVYFVVDGNHRVSVARELGQEYIDADVRECAVRVPVTADLHPDDLEELGTKVEFLERTGLDHIRPEAALVVTVLGGYDRLLEHIAVHRYFMGLDFKRDIAEAEAVGHWYDQVYQPVVAVIHDSGLLDAFPGKTETDFYLWVMDHRHYLAAHGATDLVEPGQAAEEFVEHYLTQASELSAPPTLPAES